MPEITVLWSDAEDVVKIVQRVELVLLGYRKNYDRRTATPDKWWLPDPAR